MKKITNQLKTFFSDEKGAETVEWVMIAAVLAGIIIAAFWTTLSTGVNGAITAITGDMTKAATPGA